MECPDPAVWTAWLEGTLKVEERALWKPHLADCEACSRELASLAAAGSRKAAPVRTFRWAAAAAVLILASWLAWRPGTDPSSTPASIPPSASRRVLSLPKGAEILLGEDSRMGPDGALERGSCLATGEDLLVSAAGVSFRVHGELLLTLGKTTAVSWMRSAWAGPGERVEAVVLSGRAEATLGERKLDLGPGTRLADARMEILGADALDRLREAFLQPKGAATDALPFGKASREGSGWELDGRGGKAGWLAELPGSGYRASFRLKVLEAPSVAGFSFRVDKIPALWALDPPTLADGRWHTLQILVTPAWVALVMDGRAVRRVPRAGFKPNAVAEDKGVGPLIWGGRVRVEGLILEALL